MTTSKQPNKLKIKEWTQAVADLEHATALFQVANSGFNKGSPWSVEQFLSTLNALNATVLVATLSLGEIKDQNQGQTPNTHSHSQGAEKIAGLLVATKTDEEADIYLIVVAEEFKKQGIAKQLFEYLIKECRREGLAAIFLEVRVSNLPAIRLYEALAFEQVGLRKGYYSEPIEDALVMKLAL